MKYNNLVMFLLLLVCSGGLLVGCELRPIRGKQPHESSPASSLGIQTRLQRESVNRADIAAKNIIDTSNEIEREAPQVQPKTEGIRRDADTIRKELRKISENADTVDKKIVPQILQTETDLAKTEKLLEQEKSNKNNQKGIYSILTIIFGLGAISVTGGLLLAFFNTKKGLMLAGAGLIVTSVAAAGSYYLKEIAIGGLVLSGLSVLATLAYLGRNLWIARVKEKTLEGSTEIVERLKEEISDDVRDKYFSDDGVASQILGGQDRIEMIRNIRRTKVLPKMQSDHDEMDGEDPRRAKFRNLLEEDGDN